MWVELVKKGGKWHINDLRAICLDAWDVIEDKHRRRTRRVLDVELTKRYRVAYLADETEPYEAMPYDEVCYQCIDNLTQRL